MRWILGRLVHPMATSGSPSSAVPGAANAASTPPSVRLRPWQRAAFDRFTAHESPDYLAVAKQVNQIDLYKQAAAAAKEIGRAHV